MHHLDMGHRGSEFTILHPPLKNRTIVITSLTVSLTAAFAFGLHLLDEKSLTKMCLLLALFTVLKLWSQIYSETVLIVPSLGLQVETQNYLGHVSTHFICLSQIKDIVISEALTMNNILAYLVVLLNEDGAFGQQPLYPLFTHSWPPIDELQRVYLVSQQKLLHSQTR